MCYIFCAFKKLVCVSVCVCAQRDKFCLSISAPPAFRLSAAFWPLVAKWCCLSGRGALFCSCHSHTMQQRHTVPLIEQIKVCWRLLTRTGRRRQPACKLTDIKTYLSVFISQMCYGEETALSRFVRSQAYTQEFWSAGPNVGVTFVCLQENTKGSTHSLHSWFHSS